MQRTFERLTSCPILPFGHSTDSGVATITLNRPDVLNAIDDTMLQGLGSARSAAKADPIVRAEMPTGAGRGFGAGAGLAQGATAFLQKRPAKFHGR